MFVRSDILTRANNFIVVCTEYAFYEGDMNMNNGACQIENGMDELLVKLMSHQRNLP